MSLEQSELIHANAVSINGSGVLLMGSSGIGKSDLAIRLIDRGAKLVADDQVKLKISNNGISLHPTPNIAGKIEVRELGVFELGFIENVPLKLAVELAKKVDRYPLDNQIRSIMDVQVPSIKIVSNQPSAPIKVEMALRRLLQMENHK